jgi:hypothetical protein
MRNKYFVSYTWHADNASGHGRLEVFYGGNISGSKDLEIIEKMIADLPNHVRKDARIVISGWQRFESPVRDRPISRLALAKGLR